MLEALYNTNRKTVGTIVDLDFSSQPLGSSDLVDASGRTWASIGSGNSVIEDPTMGRVMRFTGSQYYTSPVIERYDQHDFRVEMLVKPGNTVINGMFGTGDYGDRGVVLGWNIALNQYPDNYVQSFLMAYRTNYQRLLPQTRNLLTWDKYVLTKTNGTNWRLEVFRNDISIAYAEVLNYPVGQDLGSNLFLGCPAASPGNYTFNGLIKSIKVTMEK